jgi:two-component system, LytTR family, response regulator
MTQPLRVVVVDDERPARAFLVGLLRAEADVRIVGQAESGEAAVPLIEREQPHLAFLDWQMPEVTGLDVVHLLQPRLMPLVVFVTAYDEYALKAFEVNAVDYLLKPVEPGRLRATLDRVRARLSRHDDSTDRMRPLDAALNAHEPARNTPYLERVPIRDREQVLLVPVQQIASIVAQGELLVVTTTTNERHLLTYRLRDLEQRLDPARFVRLGRGILANADLIVRINVMPGGTHLAVLKNGQELAVSRLQSRLLRDRFLRL